ncbi:MAG TPA: hypothetical protein VIF60_21915 [Burkholderiaceae bacterium]|jgi:hypothetical protein
MNIKLQRTAKGEGEINHKSHALTQSQRLILASVDGMSQIDELQRRLGGMPKRRFTLAIADLTARGLVEEVVNPLAVPTKLGHEIVERFVRQDPLDPVTITALQLQPVSRAASAKRAKVVAAPVQSVAPVQIPDVDFYIPLEPRTKPLEPQVWQPPGESNLITTNGIEEEGSSSRRRARRAQRSKQILVGYWLVFAGLVCGIIFLVSMRYR